MGIAYVWYGNPSQDANDVTNFAPQDQGLPSATRGDTVQDQSGGYPPTSGTISALFFDANGNGPYNAFGSAVTWNCQLVDTYGQLNIGSAGADIFNGGIHFGGQNWYGINQLALGSQTKAGVPNGPYTGTYNPGPAAAAAQLVTDQAAVNAQKSSILAIATILGVAGTLKAVAVPGSCIGRLLIEDVHGVAAVGVVITFQAKGAGTSDGFGYASTLFTETSDANGYVWPDLPPGGVPYRWRRGAGPWMDFSTGLDGTVFDIPSNAGTP